MAADGVVGCDRGGSAAADGVGDGLDRSGSGEEVLIREESCEKFGVGCGVKEVRAYVASAVNGQQRCQRCLVSGLSVGESAGVALGGEGGNGGAGTRAPRPASTLCEVCSYARGHHHAGDVPNTAARHVVVYGSYEEREHLV